MNYIIISSLIAIFGFGLYFYKIKVKKQLEKEAELHRQARIRAQEEEKRLRLEYEHQNKLYSLNTHRVRLTLFDARSDLYKLVYLYELVIVKNYWINEPFYSKFYELLIMFEKNNFMIIDQNAKVITMNIRDSNNKVQTSRAFEVYSSRDIVESIITISMQNILQFKQQDAQNIALAICIFILEKSVHYLSTEVPRVVINNLLCDYKSVNNVTIIVELIKEKNDLMKFVYDAFEQAQNRATRYPYNDSEVPRQLHLPQKLPQKFLQEF